MSDKQHVGRVSDSISAGDDALELSRAQQKAIAEAVKPRALARERHDFGDGDRCPLVPEHGRMFVITSEGRRTQRCNHQSHDGRPKMHPEGASDPTRSLWPYDGLDAAVKEYLGNQA